MNPRDIHAVLFDMDGTLVDSDAAVERAWTTWSAEYGVDARRVLAVAHGSPAESVVEMVLPGLDPTIRAIAAGRQHELQYDDLADVVPTPGAHELLDLLEQRGLPWAVVTSADQRLARARLGAAGIEPKVLVTIEDVAQGKPHPEGYLRGAELLGVPVTACLVVEDAEVGLQAGRAAGAYTAAVKGLDGDLKLADLHQLAALL